MTKAQQHKLAIDRVKNRIKNMQNVQDLEALECYDFAICTQIGLLLQLEIITRDESWDLEEEEIDAYTATKEKVKSKFCA